MSQSLKAVLFGAGLRGAVAYAPYALAHPDQLKFVAVAEPDPERRARFAAQHDIPKTHQFASWEDVLAKPQMADVVFNCTQDQLHFASSIPTLEAGYDMLLEKPMTNTLAETVQLVQVAEKHGRLLQICHVLRYTPFYAALNDVLKSGRLGEIITVAHRENVAYHHMAHSFVRAMRGEMETLTSARASLESHLMAFAAEESRLNNTVVTMEAFRTQAEETAQ